MNKVSIGRFIYNCYLPSFEKFVYHIHNARMISKYFVVLKGNTVYVSKTNDLLTILSYVERLSTYFNFKTQ